MTARKRLDPPIPIFPNKGRPPAKDSTAQVMRCTQHGLVEFHWYKHRGWRCKRCVGEAVTRRHQKLKRILVEEAGGCCAVCGYDRCISCLHFHHVDRATKSFGINAGHGKSIAAFRAESAKCVLVCANCHGEIEKGLIACPPVGARYGDPQRVATASATSSTKHQAHSSPGSAERTSA